VAPAAKNEPPPEAPEDLEAAALAALADAPTETPKEVHALKFECPMCFEPLELPIELGGKKHPCPHCKRIISVPVPRPEQRASWRDTGPSLPTAARRPDEPAPEGAWGSSTKTGASQEGLIEAGVIQLKKKPRTRLQKALPYLVVGVPLVLLVAGGWFVSARRAASQEKEALDFALQFAQDDKSRAAVGADGLAALHGAAAVYHLRSNQPGSAGLARDQFARATALAQASRSPEAGALMVDLAAAAVGLGGDGDQIDAGTRLKWDDAQKAVRGLLLSVPAQPARLEGLRRAAAALVERGQERRVLSLAAQISTGGLADRAEAQAVVGLELLRLGKKDDAVKAAEQAEAPFAGKERKDDLQPSVVALAVALERKEPAPRKSSLQDEEAVAVGQAGGWARRGDLSKARAAAKSAPNEQAQFAALVALVAAGEGKPAPEDVLRAVAAARAGRQPWAALRLVDVGLRAGVPAADLEPAAAAAGALAGWARLLMLRAELAASKAPAAVEKLDGFAARSLAGRVARMDLSRHNQRAGGGWANTVKAWEDAPRAFGSLGVALGMEK
jgi:hypothetical protein